MVRKVDPIIDQTTTKNLPQRASHPHNVIYSKCLTGVWVVCRNLVSFHANLPVFCGTRPWANFKKKITPHVAGTPLGISNASKRWQFLKDSFPRVNANTIQLHFTNNTPYSILTNWYVYDWSDSVMILLANDFPTLRNLDKNRILGLNENTDAEALQTSIIRLFHGRFNRSRIDKGL